MTCKNCGNRGAYFITGGYDWERCDRCGTYRPGTFADVYFREPYLDPHLIDVTDKSQAGGVFIESRSQKARIMKNLGFYEKGDRVHGMRVYDKSLICSAKEQGFNLGVRE